MSDFDTRLRAPSLRSPSPSATADTATGLLQRRCACGGAASPLTGECEECRRDAPAGLQRRLAIGRSDDPLEREADRVAARVMGTPVPAGDRIGGVAPPRISRQSTNQATTGADTAPRLVDETLEAPGEPLSADLLAFFEPRFGHDFSRVRIHRDGRAAASARAVSAQAYTVGNRIAFAAGQYQPTTAGGRELLAHELTHTIQQGGTAEGATTLARRGGTASGFFSNIGRGIADLFTGSEPDYDDEVLLDYLRIIDRSGEIEDDFDSDNKARAVVGRWSRGNRDFLLTVRIKTLLVNEMLSGFVGNDDENAILVVLRESPDNEVAQILREVGVDRLNDAFHFSQQDQLDALIAAHERRRAVGNARTEATDSAAANVEGTGIDRELMQYLRYIDVRDEIRGAPDSHRHAREVVARWASGDERYFLPVRRKQLLVKELLSGEDSADDREAVLQLLRGFNNVANDVDVRLIAQDPGEGWIRRRLEPPQREQFERVLQAARDRRRASEARRTPDDEITRIVVDQEIPQTVTVHWESGATESDICSTGKGHCCVDANDAQGAACSESESRQDGSNCTPVGTHQVAFTLPNTANVPDYWTEFQNRRDIALHEYSRVDGTPLSHGCVRLRSAMARKIHEGVRARRTDVEVRGLARPRCNWPNLQAEWSGDFANANSTVDDGEPVDVQRRRRRSIGRQRATLRETHELDEDQLTEMLEGLERETDGLRSAGAIVRDRDRVAAFRSIRPVAEAIPRCVATQTVEERRLGTHPEPGAILRGSGFDRFAPAFARDLRAASSYSRAERHVRRHATALWQSAVSRAQGQSQHNVADTDDRPLYWARLQMERVLREWTPRWHRTQPGSARIGTIDDIRRDKVQLLALFEQLSRGMQDVAFDTASSAKRILISGFDPFGLQQHIDRGNPSGAAVLALDNRTLSSAGGVAAQVEGVIFPVRFSDFDQGMVERFFSPFINGPHPPDMIMTISQGGAAFEVEQFAGRRRSSGTFRDNLGTTSGGTLAHPVVPPGLAPGPEFTETTLPATTIRSALGRSAATPGETRVTEIRPGETRPVRSRAGPTPGSTAVRGAGGGFLSNEIFYRTSLLRDRAGATIPVGHLHTPALRPESADPDFSRHRDAIVARIEHILEATIDAL